MNRLVLFVMLLGLCINASHSSPNGLRLKRSPAMVSMTAIAGRGSMVVHQDETGGRVILDGRKPSDGVQRKVKTDNPTETDQDESGFVLFDTKGFKAATNSFFPIMFTDSNEGKSRQVEGAASGFADGSVAIANSFSTGKSGIANSHSTSFGEQSDRFFRGRRAADDVEDVEGRDGRNAFDNTFFPVTFEQYGSPSSRYSAEQQQADYPRNSLAISNSLATGRSGTANSHAMAFAPSLTRRARGVRYLSQEEDGSREGRGNTFFPIIFNGGSGLSSRSTQGGGEGGSPGTVSIANSFATGKSGIANSHSVAFGDPSAGNRAKRSTATLHMSYDQSAGDTDTPRLTERNARQFETPGNTYFPITFNGYGGASARSTARQGLGGEYGGSTAIANSFATGRSGVANSHATAFGDPSSAAQFFRNKGA